MVQQAVSLAEKGEYENNSYNALWTDPYNRHHHTRVTLKIEETWDEIPDENNRKKHDGE